MSDLTQDKSSGPTHDPFSIQQFARIENARSFFQNYLTQGFVAAAQWDTLELVRTRYVDGELRSHYPDLLYQVQLGGEQTAYLYLLFEHKSYIDALTSWQLLRQMVHIWHDWLSQPENANATRLPIILPLVLYHGDRAWTVSRDFIDVVDVPAALRSELAPHLPRFEHVLVDLHSIPMDEIRGSLELRAVLALLKAVSEGRELQWIQELFEPLAHVLGQPNHLQFLHELLVYLAKASGRVPASTFRAAIAKVKDEAARTAMMTLADQLKEEGREQGREQGQQQGWQLASRQAVLRVLEKRFGLVPAEIRAQIQSLTDRQKLEAALDTALTVPSISEFSV